MKTTILTKLVLFLAACFLLASCTAQKSTPVPVEGQERDQILAKSEPITDRLFQGMRDLDFATFSADFDDGMKKAETQSAFTQMVSTLDKKVGKPQSRQVAKVEKVGTHIAVTYNVQHELENPVTWRVVFTASDPMQVSGLWYDSPKLRAK